MGAFDYSLEAALFFAKGTKFRQPGSRVQTIVRAAEAIRCPSGTECFADFGFAI